MVKVSEFESVLEKLSKETFLSVDCETTGLNVWKEDQLFSVIIGTKDTQYYFNFNGFTHTTYMNLETCLTTPYLKKLGQAFTPNQMIFMANAKFDMACLYRQGVDIPGEIFDVLMMARLIYNEHFDYSLAACAKREGLEKSDAVEEFITKNHMWRWVDIPGKKVRAKKKFFEQVPFDIIVPYGKKDAEITFKLGMKYLEALKDLEKFTPPTLPNIRDVLNTEVALTKVLFEMEKTGVKIDRIYCQRAYEAENQNCLKATREFEKICGRPFVDSNKALAQAFEAVGLSGSKTEKGNPSFTDQALEAINHPLAQTVRDYREAYKKATTYYQSFLYYADEYDVVHANFRQSGTTTGRLSCSDPNLQNIPKEENDGEFKVKKAFIPREGFCFVEFDYKAMEYRLMAEYAGAKELCDRINRGDDVHMATGQMMGVPRQAAKTLNFMLLYGGGAQKLANSLGLSIEDARQLKYKYFSVLPDVNKFISTVTRITTERGFIFNWLGRRCHFPDKNFAYKAPNALIQGGCADLVKVAMVRIFEALKGYKSRMILQVHDSILFEIATNEWHLIPKIKEILEGVYPSKYLKMETSMGHSFDNWADMIDGDLTKAVIIKNGAKTRDAVQESYKAQA